MGKITEVLEKTEKNNSIFERSIREIELPVCDIFKVAGEIKAVKFGLDGDKLGSKDAVKINEFFKNSVAQSDNTVVYADGINESPATGKRVAVLFSGGPAAGGHNVVAGLFKILGNDNTLLGVKAGPKGLLAGDIFEINADQIARITNTGGFDFLGSDRTKIKTDEQFAAVKKTCADNKLDAIVVIGGDDSNTNAAVLAEYLYDDGVQVIGVPKTIDGDLQVGRLLPISFGFDTATKIYAELVGNILQDTPSSRKYWHFVKVMGRSASHVALEVGLQTKPAVCLISEEVAEKKMSLDMIVSYIAEKVVTRAQKGINHGVVIIPEGLIEFVPEMNILIKELNETVTEFEEPLATLHGSEKRDFVYGKLSAENAKLMASLPDYIEDMLLAERDSHGNLQVSLIPTEQLLIDMVKLKVLELDSLVKFATHNHFFGYEGRCGAPSLFDAAYTYNLGLIAASLILENRTGYIASFCDLDKGGKALAIPLTGLINIERRHGEDEMVIEKALVKTDSAAFKFFASKRDDWAAEDKFASPGPRQLWGPASKQIPMTVALNQEYASLEFDF